jgi:lipid II isoglutaminyl synthase (glutamine-hydrolysing)
VTAPRRGRRLTARTVAAVIGGKLAASASRRIGRGGTALPGLIVERIEPTLLSRIAQDLEHGSILITGTNGKTTTARMLAAAAKATGLRPLHNRSGSNLMRGLTATAVAESQLNGDLREPGGTIGVFEVDEATLPQAVECLRPRAVIFTNLFRDQLDRYGEVDSIAAIWRRSLQSLDPFAYLVLNADDPTVASLAGLWTGPCVRFGIDDVRLGGAGEHAADSRWCSTCGSEFSYTTLYFGHIGLWSCPSCRVQRPELEVSATRVDLGSDGTSRIEMKTPHGSERFSLQLGGLYNVYNALAASAGGLALGLPLSSLTSALSNIDAAFGRQERMSVRGRNVAVYLCKNPVGTNQVLRLLLGEPRELNLLILLNDGIADGRDISWIWDVDYELLVGRTGKVFVSGERADDMALRLKYAGMEHELIVEPDSARAVERALTSVPAGASLCVLPTYTAMLAVREQLAGLSGRGHFWEE